MSVVLGTRPEKIQKIESKFLQLLIVGKQQGQNADDDDDIDEETQKLDIERAAVMDRLQKQQASKATLKAINTQFDETVTQTINHRLAELDDVVKHAPTNHSQIALFELLLSESPDLTLVSKQVEKLEWLSEDLINMVNSAAFRHRRPKGSDVKVTDLKLVMSYIGIENLQTLVPYYCVRNWLPDTQANLKWTNKKLWRYVSITSIASQALAEKYNKNKISLYICGLLFQLGIMVILTSCATIYDDIRTFWLKKASESNDENIQDAVLACDLPRQFVYENTLNKASLFNWQLLELMHFEDSKITKVLKELHQTGNYSDLSEETAMIARASCFAKVIMMEEQHKLYPQDRELICNYYQLDDEEMLLLRDLNYHQLDIA